MSNGRNSKGVLVWAILSTVLLAGSLAANLILFVLLLIAADGGFGSRLGRESVFQEETLGGNRAAHNKIAVIYLTGLISYEVAGVTGEEGMVGDLREQLRVAVKDRDVKGILLVIDSPGGKSRHPMTCIGPWPRRANRKRWW